MFVLILKRYELQITWLQVNVLNKYLGCSLVNLAMSLTSIQCKCFVYVLLL